MMNDKARLVRGNTARMAPNTWRIREALLPLHLGPGGFAQHVDINLNWTFAYDCCLHTQKLLTLLRSVI